MLAMAGSLRFPNSIAGSYRNLDIVEQHRSPASRFRADPGCRAQPIYRRSKPMFAVAFQCNGLVMKVNQQRTGKSHAVFYLPT